MVRSRSRTWRGSRAQRAAEKVAAAATVASVLADKHLAATVAELASIEARLAADNARYATPTATDAAERTAAAIAATNRAAICAGEEAVLVAESAIAALPAEAADDKQKQERKKAEETLAAGAQSWKQPATKSTSAPIIRRSTSFIPQPAPAGGWRWPAGLHSGTIRSRRAWR